jgi:predicted nucleic acid-binding protein
MKVDAYVADSNVLIDLLKGDARIKKLLRGVPIHVSFMTEVEVLAWPKATKEDLVLIRALLVQCIIVDPSPAIKEATITLRSSSKLRIADCFVAATAQVLELPLLTRDQAFKKVAKELKVELL